MQIDEQKETLIQIGDADAKYLVEKFAARLTVNQRPGIDGVFINPRQYVGVIALPSGEMLRVVPKVPIRNLFYMMAVAFRLPEFEKESAGFETFDELLELAAIHFADLVTARIDQGVYRSYVELHDDLSTLKGRILFPETIRKNMGLRHSHHCSFTEFTADVNENRIIRYVAHLLSQWSFSRQTTRRLQTIDSCLSDVSHQVFESNHAHRFTYHRFNEDYRPIHQLCSLFLEGASTSHRAGSVELRTFLIDMNRLFETFVSELLRQQMPSGIMLELQRSFHLDEDHVVELIPDITVRQEGLCVAVADCKYVQASDNEFDNDNVYQVLAYCVGHDVKTGVLIYPKQSGRHLKGAIQILNCGVSVRQISIDLGSLSVKEDCEDFCNRFINIVNSKHLPQPNEHGTSAHVN